MGEESAKAAGAVFASMLAASMPSHLPWLVSLKNSEDDPDKNSWPIGAEQCDLFQVTNCYVEALNLFDDVPELRRAKMKWIA